MGAWFGFGTAFAQKALPPAEEVYMVPPKVKGPTSTHAVSPKSVPVIDMSKVRETPWRTDEPVIPLAPR